MTFFLSNKSRKKKGKSKYTQDFIIEHGCKVCPLQKGLKNPKVPPSGSKSPIVYVLGETGGQEEDLKNKQFVGVSGKYLRERLVKVFGKKYEDMIRFNNCVRCRTVVKKGKNKGKNRNPELFELDFCRSSVEQDIADTKPTAIFGFGQTPLKWLGIKDAIGLWRGRRLPVKIKDHVCWFFPMFHPSHLVRNTDYKGFDTLGHVFEMDLYKAKTFLTNNYIDTSNWKEGKKGITGFEVQVTPFYTPDWEYVDKSQLFENIIYLDDWDEIQFKLNEYRKKEYIAIDIENNPLRPYNKGKILSIAIGTWDETIAFVWKNKYKKVFYNFLINSGKKICHNLQHEIEWFVYMYGKDIVFKTEWECTYSQAYVLDPRKQKGKDDEESSKGLLGLGDQTRINFGIDIKEYSPIDYPDCSKTPKPDLLKGNGMDARFTDRLFHVQSKKLKNAAQEHVYRKHIDRACSLALTQIRGVNVSTIAIKKHNDKYQKEAEKVFKKINKDKDVKKHIKIHGEFNPRSPHHLLRVLRDYKKLKAIKGTKNKKKEDGGFSTDESVMEIYAEKGIPLATNIVEYRKWMNLISKYGEESMKNVIYNDGKFHASFGHAGTGTSRLNCKDPNLQNVNKKKNKEVRSIIIPNKNNYLLAVDFGQIQVRNIADESEDETLREYCRTNHDFHKDFAEIFAKLHPKVIGGKKFIKDKQVMKDWRDRIKNEYDFPKFFGSHDYKCAENMGIPVKLVEKVTEKYFWGRFGGVREWHERIIKFYKKHGYIESKFGRRRYAPLNENQIINSSIQADEGEIVDSAQDRLSKKGYELDKPQLQSSIHVHDELVFSIPKKTLDEDMEIIAREMVRIPDELDYITVPLVIELELGSNWAEMEGIGEFSTTDFYEM